LKFLFVPLLIIGMFVSFGAALIAMLFFTDTVQTTDDLERLFSGGLDSTEVFDEFRLSEDRLQAMFDLATEYKNIQEEQTQKAEALLDSLTGERSLLQALEDSLMQEKQRLGLVSDSTRTAKRDQNLSVLAKFYESLKAQSAAEILQQESELSDTSVAALMNKLSPRQMAKIMANMNPDYAARITAIINEQSP
jgi:flagellar motility protein MotE (MotC chaperone)